MDDLTGLLSRGAFLRALEEEVAASMPRGQPLCLLLIDLDYLKSINDHYGHPAGDAALCAVAAVLKDNLRGADLAGRYGGDEFLVLLPGQSCDAGLSIAERLRATVAARPFTPPGQQINLSLSLSIGVAALPADGQDAAAMMAAADRSVYAAKAAGRNCVGHVPRADSAQPNHANVPGQGGRMVGRQTQLGHLRCFLETACLGRGGLAIVEGEAGIGKTRLVEEVAGLARLLGMQVLWARCHHLEIASPYHPFLDGLAPLIATADNEALTQAAGPWAGEVARLLPALHHRMPDAAPLPPLPPEEDRLRLHQALCHFLIGLAHTPTLLVLDDLQWADGASMRILNHLAWQLDAIPLLIVCTARTEELVTNAPHVDTLAILERHGRLRGRITLERLSTAEASALVRTTVGLRWPPDAVQQQLIEETSGNPLFLLETLRLLIEQQILYEDHGRWRVRMDAICAAEGPMGRTLPMAPTVGAVIEARLDRLGDRGRDILAIAAVLGTHFEPDTVIALASRHHDALEDRAWAALEWLERQRIVMPSRGTGASYEFTHPLIRQVAYQQLNRARRRMLHRQAARLLAAAGASPGEVAEHYWQGDEPGKALSPLVQAARTAASIHAVGTAIDYYARALTAAGNREGDTAGLQLQTIHEALGDLHDLSGDWQKAIDAYQQALSLELEDCAHTASLWCKIGDLCVRRGEHTQAHAAYEAAAGQNEGSSLPDPIRASLLLGRAHLYLDQAAYAQATNLAAAARTLLEQCEPPEPGRSTRATRLLGTAALQTGDLQAAAHWFSRGLAESKEAGHLDGVAYFLSRVATLDFRHGDLTRAEQGYREALAIAERIGNQRIMSACQGNLGVIADTRGLHGEAREWYLLAAQTFERMGDWRGISASYHNLGLVAKITGDYGEARTRFARSLALDEQNGDLPGVAISLIDLGGAEMECGDFAAVERYVLRATVVSEQVGDPALISACLAQRAQLAIERGDPAAALVLCEQGRQMAGDNPERAAYIDLIEANALLLRDREGTAATLALAVQDRASVLGLGELVMEAMLLRTKAHLCLGAKQGPGQSFVAMAGPMDEEQIGKEAALQALDQARQQGARFQEAVALRLLGQAIGPTEEAEPYLRESLALCERIGSAVEGARTRLILAGHLDQVDAVEQRALLEAARDAFAMAGAAHDLALVDAAWQHSAQHAG